MRVAVVVGVVVVALLANDPEAEQEQNPLGQKDGWKLHTELHHELGTTVLTLVQTSVVVVVVLDPVVVVLVVEPPEQEQRLEGQYEGL